MKNVYVVFCKAVCGDPTWDTFVGKYATLDAAKSAADEDWRYTSPRDRKNRTTFVARVEIPDCANADDFFDFIDAGYFVEYTARD